MDKIYKGVDAVLTPHRIVTRITGEALSCGTPIIASKGCKVTPFLCDPHDPHSVSATIKEFINSDQEQNRKNALEESKKFNLINYSKVMNEVYNEILNKK
jgi:glycosyltransferase involved in cell wall biosynthesis